MADLQLQQQDPILRPVLAAWPAKPFNMKELTLHAGVGAAVLSTLPEREEWDPPSWAG